MTDTIHLYGDIGSSFWFEGLNANDLVLSLKELDSEAEAHHIHINSPGGLVSEGLAMMNVLRTHKATMKNMNPNFKLKTYCDGYAMSAATCPFMAGDERIVALGGILMIHEAWNYSGGNSVELRKIADDLDQITKNAAMVYSTLCTQAKERTPEYFLELMKAETYMIGDEALKHGMATSVDNTAEARLSASLTPEKMKGNYVNLMTKNRVKTTLNHPVNPKAILERDKAFQLLDQVILELGLTKP